MARWFIKKKPKIEPPDPAAIERQEVWAIISPTTGRAIIWSVRSTRWACYLCFVRDEKLKDGEFKERGYSMRRLKISLSDEGT